jgi:hypothetical protein
MKKLLITLALAVGAMNSGFAADLYVNNSGQSGTYTTIQAAINAASTGDNIYVSPLNSYQESLSITKSIRIASSVAGSRIIVTQDIKISPLANILVELIGVEGTNVILDTQTSTLGPNTRGKAIITDCSFHDINLNTDYLTLLVVKCTLSGTLTGRHGKVIGNTISEKIIINDEPNIGIGDTVVIKANNVTGNIEVGTDDHSVLISNNIANRILIRNWRYGATISGLISNNSVLNKDATRVKSTGNGSNSSFNFNTLSNYIDFEQGNINIRFATSSQNGSNLSIINNYIDHIGTISVSSGTRTGSSTYGYNYTFKANYYSAIGISDYLPTTYPIVQYNIFDAAAKWSGATSYTDTYWSFYSKGWASSGQGIYNLSTNVGDSNNQQISQEGKDKGSPSPKFFDADLTRSDIGHLGADNSWEMFHGTNSVTGAAYIIGLNLPSEIWPGQTVNLKAEAVHTN